MLLLLTLCVFYTRLLFVLLLLVGVVCHWENSGLRRTFLCVLVPFLAGYLLDGLYTMDVILGLHEPLFHQSRHLLEMGALSISCAALLFASLRPRGHGRWWQPWTWS